MGKMAIHTFTFGGEGIKKTISGRYGSALPEAARFAGKFRDDLKIGFLWTRQMFEEAASMPGRYIGNACIQNISSHIYSDGSNWLTAAEILHELRNRRIDGGFREESVHVPEHLEAEECEAIEELKS